MKVCSKCNQELPLDCFTKSKTHISGYRNYCKKCACAYAKKSRENNPDKIASRHKEYYQKNKESINTYNREWRKNNPDRVKELKLSWYTNNKEKVTRYKRDKYHNDLQYKLASLLRRRINQAIHKSKKSKSTLKLLGCSLDDFKKHIESLWQEGMSWDNYGEWHIDHKIPCATFDLTLEENQVKCFHYSNLRPLWRMDNLSRPKFGQDLSEVKITP